MLGPDDCEYTQRMLLRRKQSNARKQLKIFKTKINEATKHVGHLDERFDCLQSLPTFYVRKKRITKKQRVMLENSRTGPEYNENLSEMWLTR